MDYFRIYTNIPSSFYPTWIIDWGSTDDRDDPIVDWLISDLIPKKYEKFEFWKNIVRGVAWNAPKSMWKRNLPCDGICIFFEMPRNRRCSFSVHFLFSESNGKNLIDHVLFFRNAPLFYTLFFWNAPFFPFDSENRKWTEN